MSRGKVLLVDDERDFVDALSQRLESRGLTVETASNGVEALEKAFAEDFDVIFLDLVMPKMDGLETLKKLHAEKPGLQVILLTGRGDLKSGVEAMKLGAEDFLEKPADIQQLMDKIDTAQTNKVILVEKESEEKIKNILETKGW